MAELIEINSTKKIDQSPFTTYVNVPQQDLCNINYGKNGPSSAVDFTSLPYKRGKQLMRTALWSADDPVRKTLWTDLIKSRFKDKELYNEVIKDLYKSGVPDPVPLSAIVDENHQMYYHLTHEGTRVVRMVINCIEHLKPDITSCPLLLPITSILLHYTEPEWCMCFVYNMIVNIDRYYLSHTKIAAACTYKTIADLSERYMVVCLQSRLPEENKEEISDWLWWIFDHLPFPYIVCIMDSFLYEGHKVFYRVALVIVKKFLKHSKTKPTSSESFSEQICKFCRDITIPISKFMKSAFKLRRLSDKRIHKLIKQHEVALTSAGVFPSVDAAPREVRGLEDVEESLLTPSQMSKIWSWCPTRFSTYQPMMLYNSNNDGVSIQTLFNKCSEYCPTIIIVRTSNGEIFGAYCSGDWKDRKLYSYFGSGECFVFTVSPEMIKFEWSGCDPTESRNTVEMFMSGGSTHLMIGGGSTGPALHFDALMEHCTSSPCETFSSPPLCQCNSNSEFSCQTVQVLGFK